MLAIVKTIDNVKQLVPLDKTLAPAMDIVPNNTIMKFSNTTNSLVDSGWQEITQCNGQIRALTLSGDMVCHRSIDITRSYNPNTWGTYNWECPNRDRMAIGAGNAMNGYGYKQVYGFANVACPMCDSTTILLGSVNAQCYGATSGLTMGIGVYNYFYHKIGTTISYGLSNCNYGICDPNLPAECAACEGISESSLIGIYNKVCTAWSHVHGSSNTLGGWSSINTTDPETHITTNSKAVGSNFAFGNSNCAHGAGVTIMGHSNCSCYALNSVIIGIDNHLYGCSEAGYKYNQFALGIANCSCAYDILSLGTSNTINAPMSTAVGRWNVICAGAAGGLALGNGAVVKNCRGFTRSLIRVGGAGTGPGTSADTAYITQTWMISGCGTLEDFYYAMAGFGTKDHNFIGDLKLALGATCGSFNMMNKYSGASRSEQLSGDVWFTGGSFSFQDNVEWFLAGTNTHDNFIMRDVYQYLHCPVEAHISIVSG